MEEGSTRMGLMDKTPLAAPAPRGILDPATGKPAGANDPFYLTLNDQLADKGFLVTTADDLIIWARTGSLMWMTFGLACWAVGVVQIAGAGLDGRGLGLWS